MCDSDPASIEYFSKHLELMKNLGQCAEYRKVESVTEFFDDEQGGNEQ